MIHKYILVELDESIFILVKTDLHTIELDYVQIVSSLIKIELSLFQLRSYQVQNRLDNYILSHVKTSYTS